MEDDVRLGFDARYDGGNNPAFEVVQHCNS
jgi:hypothetical protein